VRQSFSDAFSIDQVWNNGKLDVRTPSFLDM
jgi:hypothetical protein